METNGWAASTALAALALNACLLIVVVMQLRHGIAATKLDHERRKKQATIEFYAATIEARQELMDEMPRLHDNDAITGLIEAASNDENSDAARNVAHYLGLFEMLSVAANTDTFDLETIDRLVGSRILRISEVYSPWIESRLENARPGAKPYGELLRLAKRLREMRAVPPGLSNRGR